MAVRLQDALPSHLMKSSKHSTGYRKNMRPSHSSHDFFYTFVFVNQPPTTLQSEDYETLCTLPDLMPECDRCADLMFHICKNRTTGRDIFHRQHHGISGRCIHPRQHHRHHSDRRGDRRHVDYCRQWTDSGQYASRRTHGEDLHLNRETARSFLPQRPGTR